MFKKKISILLSVFLIVLLAACGKETLESIINKSNEAMKKTESVAFAAKVDVKDMVELKLDGRVLGLKPESKVKDVSAYMEFQMKELNTPDAETIKMAVYLKDGFTHAYDYQEKTWEMNPIKDADKTLKALYEETEKEMTPGNEDKEAMKSIKALEKIFTANMQISKEKTQHVISFVSTPEILGQIIESSFMASQGQLAQEGIEISLEDESVKEYVDMVKEGFKFDFSTKFDKSFKISDVNVNASMENEMLVEFINKNKIEASFDLSLFNYNQAKPIELPKDAIQ